MNPVKENEKIYTAYLCSRIPNNECDLCSHFIPDYVSQTQPVRHPFAFGYHAHDKCPSCKRSVVRLFLSPEMTKPSRVPSDFPFRFPDDVLCGHFEAKELRNMSREQRMQFALDIKPSHIRADLDWDARNTKLQEYFEASVSGNSRKSSENSFEKLNEIPIERGKEIKKKLRFQL